MRAHTTRVACAALIGLLPSLLGVPGASATSSAQTSEFASVLPGGTAAITPDEQVLSGDGRYVAFRAMTPDGATAYWRDLSSGASTRIDLAVDGTDPGAHAHLQVAGITGDGRYVLLLSSNPAMEPQASPWGRRVYLRDVQEGTTTRVLLGDAGAAENAEVTSASITPDGRYLVFVSEATNLLPDAGQPGYNVWRRDLHTSTNALVSVVVTGTAPTGILSDAAVQSSDDGRYVAFSSDADNLVAGDTNARYDVFLRDVQEGTTELVSRTASALGDGDSVFRGRGLSADGRYVVFESSAQNLVSGDQYPGGDSFRYDSASGTLSRVSALGYDEGAFRPSISADGRFVAFHTSSGVDPYDGNGFFDVYVRDMLTTTFTRTSRSATGGSVNNDSSTGRISADGSHVAFLSQGKNIDPDFAFAGVIVTTLDRTPPPAAGGLQAMAGSTVVKLWWGLPQDAAKVIVRRAVGTTPPSDVTSGTSVLEGAATSTTASGLANGTAYSFAVFTVDRSGNIGPASSVSGVTPRPAPATTTTLSRSAGTITYGSSITLTALLRDGSGQPAPNGTLSFYGRKKGTTTWTLLQAGPSGPTGYLMLPTSPGSTTEYLAKHASDAYYGGSASQVVTVSVRPRLTAAAGAPSALLGTSSAIKGTVTPAHYGQPVHLQQLVSGSWRTITSATLGSTGGYGFTVRPASSGNAYYRVYKPADSDHLAVVSPSLKVSRYRAAITSIHYDAAGNDWYALNDEYVTVKNTGAVAVNLAGWRLSTRSANQSFLLPSCTVAPGATVRIHTGVGSNGGGHVYLRSSRPLWSNSGDVGSLYDARGALVSRYSY